MSKTKWTWQQAVMDSELQPMTKFLLLTLSTYMNMHGTSCFPSQSTLAEKMSSSKRTIIKHLHLAEQSGYLVKRRMGMAGQQHSKLEYEAVFPQRELDLEGRGAPDSPLEGVHQIHPSEVKEIHQGVNVVHVGVNQIHPRGERDSPKYTNEQPPPSSSARARMMYDWLMDFFEPSTPYLLGTCIAWVSIGADLEIDVKIVAERFKKREKKAPAALSWLTADIEQSISERAGTKSTKPAPLVSTPAEDPVDAWKKSPVLRSAVYARAEIAWLNAHGLRDMANRLAEKYGQLLDGLAEAEKKAGQTFVFNNPIDFKDKYKNDASYSPNDADKRENFNDSNFLTSPENAPRDTLGTV